MALHWTTDTFRPGNAPGQNGADVGPATIHRLRYQGPGRQGHAEGALRALWPLAGHRGRRTLIALWQGTAWRDAIVLPVAPPGAGPPR